LVAIHQLDIYRKRAALYIDAVSSFRPLCVVSDEQVLECSHHRLVAAFSFAFRQPFRARLVGFLKADRAGGKKLRPIFSNRARLF
jgi:hypothetical protein